MADGSRLEVSHDWLTKILDERDQLRADLARVKADRAALVEQAALLKRERDSAREDVARVKETLEHATRANEQGTRDLEAARAEAARLRERVRAGLDRLTIMNSWDAGQVYCASAVENMLEEALTSDPEPTT